MYIYIYIYNKYYIYYILLLDHSAVSITVIISAVV